MKPNISNYQKNKPKGALLCARRSLSSIFGLYRLSLSLSLSLFLSFLYFLLALTLAALFSFGVVPLPPPPVLI